MPFVSHDVANNLSRYDQFLASLCFGHPLGWLQSRNASLARQIFDPHPCPISTRYFGFSVYELRLQRDGLHGQTSSFGVFSGLASLGVLTLSRMLTVSWPCIYLIYHTDPSCHFALSPSGPCHECVRRRLCIFGFVAMCWRVVWPCSRQPNRDHFLNNRVYISEYPVQDQSHHCDQFLKFVFEYKLLRHLRPGFKVTFERGRSSKEFVWTNLRNVKELSGQGILTELLSQHIQPK